MIFRHCDNIRANTKRVTPQSAQSFRLPLALLALTILTGPTAIAGIAPENVVVVVNSNSPASREIAAEYVRLRDIPPCNLIPLIGLPSKDRIPVEAFRQQILRPILDTINQRGLSNQIDVIAYSSEIPTSIDLSGDIGAQRLPNTHRPVASINGLTFLYAWVLAKDLRYMDLDANAYAPGKVKTLEDSPWTDDEKRLYGESIQKLAQLAQATRAAKDDTPQPRPAPDSATRQMQEVVDRFTQLQKKHPRSGELHYNRACGLALLGQPDTAVAALREAVKADWSDYQHTAQDSDLRSLANRADFQTLLKDMRTTAVAAPPSKGFRSTTGWLADGSATDKPGAPRYLLSIVLACTTGRGTTVQEAIAHLRRAAQSDGTRPAGTIYFERNDDVRSTTREWAFHGATRQLTTLGVHAVVEDGILPQQRKDVAGAVIGAADFDWPKSGSTILPGAIVEHLTSFGGDLQSNACQTPLTVLLKAGAAGASGTVAEPFALQAKFPSPFIHAHYAAGCTLVESFYQSVTGPYQLLIVGDPLAQPWRRHFIVRVPNLANGMTVTGEIQVDVRTESKDGITAATHELYVDGLRVAACKATEPLRWNSRPYRNGEHAITVLARGNDPLQSIARHPLRIQVRNNR